MGCIGKIESIFKDRIRLIFFDKPANSMDHCEFPAAVLHKCVLTDREVDIIKLLSEGHSRKSIANIRYVSPKTIDNAMLVIYKKLNIYDIANLTRFAIRTGISSL